MTRPLIAWVPIRGTFWSALSGGCVTHWRMDRKPTSTLAIRTRVTLARNAWWPGDPSELPIRSTSRVPTVDDGIPIKNAADIFIEHSSSLRGRAVVLRIDSTRIEDVFAQDPGWKEPTFSRDGLSLKLDRNLDAFQMAPPRRRAELLGQDTTIGWDIDGIQGPTASIDFTVGALVHFRENDPILVEMLCDSVHVDLNRHEMELVWRGIYSDPRWGADVERILIGILPPGLDEDKQTELLAEGLPHAVFVFAATNDDIKNGIAPPNLREEELTIARLSSWEKGPGAPSLTADEFALISAELSSGKRADVLRSHGFDEIAWGQEEWAQGERVANESAELPDDIGDDEAATKFEIKPVYSCIVPKVKLEIADYARLSAHIEMRDPARVLEEANLSVSEFIAIEQTMSDAMEDAQIAAEFDRLLPTYHDEAIRAHAADLVRHGIDLQEEEISQ